MNELITAPLHYEINGKDWWVQEVRNSKGEVVLINLLDEDGYFVAEYKTVEEALAAANNAN